MGWFVNGKCRSDARLDGKIAIVTGANTGIGKVTARVLAERGAHVIMACRNVSKAEQALEEIKKNLNGSGSLIVMELDLSSLDSVRKFCKKFLESYTALHLLINNAGVMMCPRELSADGYELHFATNHLGHFLLTLTLLPTIKKSAPARIVNVASKIHIFTNSLKFDDINLENSYSPTIAYARSKLANILFTKELAKRLENDNVTVYSLHPGVVQTELTRHVDSSFFRGANRAYNAVGSFFMKTPEQGAQTTLYCALDEQVGKETGLYYDDCARVRPTKAARDPNLAKQLWEKSVEMVKLDFDPFV